MARCDRLSSLQAPFDRWHVPVLVGLAAAALTVLVSHALAVREDDQFALLVESRARRVRAEVREGLNARLHGMRILAQEWEERLLPMRGAWESDVRLLLSQSPGLESIAWIGPDGRPSWVYPPHAQVAPLDAAVREDADASPAAALLAAEEGGPLLSIQAPLVVDGAVRGWLVGSYRARELLSDIVTRIESNSAVSVAAGGEELFHSRTPSGGAGSQWVRRGALALPGGLELQVEVEPSPEMVAAGHSQLPRATTAGGLALSALLALALGLRNRASSQARALAAEVVEHRRAQQEIRRLNAQLEERVRQRTAELSHSNDELRRFASFLSHELRQPLGTQALWLEMLATDCGEALGEEGRGHLENVRACTQRMSELITAQLALSDAAAGAEPVSVDLDALVGEVLRDLGPSLDAAGAKLHVGALPTLLGDARQLYTLFRNLVENALKYRREDQTLEIAIALRDAGDPAALAIEVEDNGRGFAPEQAERIFEPHARLAGGDGSQPADDRGGQGLGLSIARRAAERHGGRLTAEGEPGRGARFRIALPRARVVAPADASAVAQSGIDR